MIERLLSNNRAERSIKPFVMGRKNWLFANTPAGAVSSSVIYSLIETAKENQLDPYKYFKWVFCQAPQLAQTHENWPVLLIPLVAPDECKNKTIRFDNSRPAMIRRTAVIRL